MATDVLYHEGRNPSATEPFKEIEPNAETSDKDELPAVRIKYKASHAKVTNLEATMSPFQLYKANNYLWANGITINQIERILEAETYTDKERREETIREILGESV